MADKNDNTGEAKAMASLKEKSDDVLQSLGIGNLTTTPVTHDTDIDIRRRKYREKKRKKCAGMNDIEKE